ncbi:MAG TPA: SGNH/GDSL hydrolase family protein [Thermoleophilia bacterium]
MSAFKAGLRQRNPLVLAFGGLLLLPAFVLLQAFFTSGAWSNIPLHYWVRNPIDDSAFVSWSVGRAKQRPPTVPSVYVVGGSSAREALVSGASLAADVHRLGGPRIVAWDMGSIRQTFAESLAIADNVPANDAWIVIGVNLGRFAGDAETSMGQAVGKGLLLKSDYLKRYVATTYGRYRYDPTILPGIFLYLSDLTRAYIRGAGSGALAAGRYDLHRVDAASQLSVQSKQRAVKAWYRLRYPDFKEYFAMNTGMLDRLLARCRQRGLHVLLVELPVNADIVGHQFDAPTARYRAQVRRLAGEYRVPYVDFNAELALPNKDFYDMQHLVQPGRSIWQQRLAQELVQRMGADGKGAVTAP